MKTLDADGFDCIWVLLGFMEQSFNRRRQRVATKIYSLNHSDRRCGIDDRSSERGVQRNGSLHNTRHRVVCNLLIHFAFSQIH